MASHPSSSCDYHVGLINFGVCSGHGTCATDTSLCVCDPGYTSRSDWLEMPSEICMFNATHVRLTAIILGPLALLAAIVVLNKARLLWHDTQTGRRNMDPFRISLLMALPPTIIALYEFTAAYSSEPTLLRNVVLVIYFILLNLAWQSSSFIINRWLIRSAESAGGFTKNQAKFFIRLQAGVNICSFLALSIILTLLYTIKFQQAIRFYTGATVIFVLVHIIPYQAAHKIEAELSKHLQESGRLRVPESSTVVVDLNRAISNVAAVRRSFLGTSSYLAVIIFLIFIEFSPYYMQFTFANGILCSMGCYSLFPDKEAPEMVSEEEIESLTGTAFLPDSALSDTMVTNRTGTTSGGYSRATTSNERGTEEI
eukprot:TRINITY_DN6811_c0_g1_i1.p1 TRINITY_DN6811_c0_g1~~TRINITY_DN6811_c0_g1_i1.p1  ORF type:complete len:369 (-),score=33.11 TRINITY_DN6811_c0_g1_i1:172-1278(-)